MLSFLKGKLNIEHLYIFLIFLSCLVFLFWVEPGYILRGGDVSLSINPSYDLRHLSTWIEDNGGRYIILNRHYFVLFFYFLKSAGVPLFFITGLYLFFHHLIAGLGMYYLSRLLFSEEKNKTLISFLASIFYLFSPACLNLYYAFAPYYFLPLLLALFIDGFRKGKFFMYSVLFAVCLYPGIIHALPNPKSFVFIFSLVGFTSLHLIFFEKAKIKKLFLYLLFILVSCLALNAWFFLPYLVNIFKSDYVSFLIRSNPLWGDPTKGLVGGEGYCTILSTLRLFFGMNVPVLKEKYYLSLDLIKITNYIYPFLAFLSIFFVSRIKKITAKRVLLLFFIALFFMFIAKGPNPPLGAINKNLLLHVPLYKMFRSTGEVLVILAICFALLTGFTLGAMLMRIKNKIGKAMLVAMAFVFLFVNSYPLFLGYITLNRGRFPNSDPTKHGIKIPESYYAVGNYLKSKEDNDKVLLLPLRDYEVTKWGFFGPTILPSLLERPTLFSLGPISQVGLDDWRAFLSSTINQGDPYSQQLLGLSNIRYVLVQMDLAEGDPAIYQKNAQAVFNLIKSTGDLYLYEINDSYYLPRIYVPEVSYILEGEKRNIVDIMKFNSDTKKAAMVYQNCNSCNTGPENEHIIKNAKSIFIFPRSNISAVRRFNPGDKLKEVDSSLVYLDKKNTFFAPMKGNYVLYIKKDSILGQTNGVSVVVDGKEIIYKNNETTAGNNNWHQTGEIKLDKGEHFFNLKFGNEDINIIKSGDFLFKLDNSQYDQFSNIPKISFQKINSTKYKIKVDNAVAPFYLVFSENFHGGWEAYFTNGKNDSFFRDAWFKKNVPSDNHFLVNGFANGWYIVPPENNFNITVEYSFQKLLYFGYCISGLYLFSFFIYLFLRTNKERKKEDNLIKD
ncbi:hypothetical protein KAS79_02030 [Candidatus Parcubacteria bacterium]|nr:hypothetical protein [Candidatus Parcubacteria bacterium]